MDKWLDFFKDKHVSIALNEDSIGSDVFRKMFSATEKVSMSEQDLIAYLNNNKQQQDSLEGIWEDASNIYRIGIIREKDSHDKFVGFILKADSAFWMPGQIKMKIKKSGNKYGFGAYLSRYHLASTPPLTVNKYSFEIGPFGSWYKVHPGNGRAKPGAEVSLHPYFRVLDKQTCLLAIPSAGSFAYKNEVDSILEKNDAIVKSAEHFIIDVRDNRGGTTLCFEKLLPLIYTNPFITKGASVLASEDNVRHYDKWDYPNVSDSMKAVFQKEAKELRAHQGTLYNLWPDDTLKFNAILPYPKRVSILINEECASSTEMFLLKARQSRKVKLYGRHTMGAVDYADVATLNLTDGFFLLRYSTSRSNRLPSAPIDNIGIQPDVTIPDNVQDWVAYVRMKTEGR
jgi:hypothetical protein